MAGTYLTMSDIVNWIDEWHSKHPTYTKNDVADFAEELNGKIGQIDFRASNGGMAIGLMTILAQNEFWCYPKGIKFLLRARNDSFSITPWR